MRLLDPRVRVQGACHEVTCRGEGFGSRGIQSRMMAWKVGRARIALRRIVRRDVIRAYVVRRARRVFSAVPVVTERIAGMERLSPMIVRLLQGTLAGYAGTAVMDASQTSIIPAVSSWIEGWLGSRGKQGQEEASEEEPLSSPEKVARRGAELVGIQLDREQIAVWGNRVHWAYGIQWGIIYLLLRRAPGPVSGFFYGVALWAVSDELLLWALGIAKAPTAYPPKIHLQALAAHCVYGTAVGAVARGLRR